MEEEQIYKVIETLLFITDEPIKAERIARICEVKNVKSIEEKLEKLKYNYDIENKALAIMKIAGGWQMSTRNEYSIWVRKLYQTRLTMRLSNAALETLAIVAYKQPVTRAEIEKIRGVDVGGPLDTLLERKLVAAVGRKETPGKPIIFATTEEFLRQFGLNSLNDLPTLDTMISKESIERAESLIKTGENPSQGKLFEKKDMGNLKENIEKQDEIIVNENVESKAENIEKDKEEINEEKSFQEEGEKEKLESGDL